MTSLGTGNWLRVLRAAPGGGLRLTCFPHAGGGAAAFHEWPQDVPTGIELCAVRLAARESRLDERPVTKMAALADEFAWCLEGYLDGPYAFFGHSMGALLGFEVARRLSAAGHAPAHLFVAGCRAPQLPRRQPPISTLPDAEFLEALRELNGTPDAILNDAELMQLALPALRADFTACESYACVAGPPVGCPITAFGGTCDPEASADELAAWSAHTSDFALEMHPGDHFFVGPSRRPIVATITRRLELSAPVPTRRAGRAVSARLPQPSLTA